MANRHLLPWEKERAEYAARPHCYVARDWARMALNKLAEKVATAGNNEVVTFHFNGEILTIRCAGEVMAMAATGSPWNSYYSIRAGMLDRLSKRLMRESVEFSIYNSMLTIGNTRYSGILQVELEK